MSVDLFERRFLDEVIKLPSFEPNDKYDRRAWEEGFPAWRALFASLCLYGHSTGYRLPSFDNFFDYCKGAFSQRHPQKDRYKRYFEGDLLPGMRQRASVWYESGMAEIYLYACLVEAIEDKSKCGVVLYDPRVDWKLKADLIAIVKKQPLRVSAFVGERAERPNVEARRDAVEHERKKNTSASAHWENTEIKAMPIFEIARTIGADTQTVNGIRLFSLPAVNRLLTEIYKKAEVAIGYVFPVQ